jgi:L-ascorbate metabolism protein UlaG (beta-lactamase superfamily)
MTVHYDDLTVDWLGYATVRLEADDTVVYLDPGRYGTLTGEWGPDTPGVGHPEPTDYHGSDGDVVCVTHDHHYDSDAIRRVAKDDATLVIFEGVNTHNIDRDVDRPSDLPYEVRRVDDEADVAVGDAIIRTVAAYNDPDGPYTRPNGEPYHPKGFGCGFLVTLGGKTAFWPGDTDVLEGHERLDVDIFLPPIGGSFTMDRHEAADLAAEMEPELVVPIHYNTFEALETDSEAFAVDVAKRGIPVALDEN